MRPLSELNGTILCRSRRYESEHRGRVHCFSTPNQESSYRTCVSWNLLVNVVLAIGAFCRAPNITHVVDHFMEKATANLGVETLECGSLTLVQAFTLLSNLSQKRNKPNAGSVYLGIAVRMAIGLGLHRELPLWEISPFEREVR